MRAVILIYLKEKLHMEGSKRWMVGSCMMTLY